jgi:hypothetical protein
MPLSGYKRLSGTAPVEFSLDIRLAQRHASRDTINDYADDLAVRLAISRDPKNFSEGVSTQFYTALNSQPASINLKPILHNVLNHGTSTKGPNRLKSVQYFYLFSIFLCKLEKCWI